jgi:predicted ATP-dependent serine protease
MRQGQSNRPQEAVGMDADGGLQSQMMKEAEARARNNAEGEEERRILRGRMGCGVGKDASTSADAKHGSSQRIGNAQELLSMVVKGRFICLIGPPASGKTVTMLQVACAACTVMQVYADKDSEENGVPPHVPIFMRAAQLSSLVTQESKQIKSLEALIRLYISHQYPNAKYPRIANLLMQFLKLRRVLVIIDGMDEAAGHRRMIEKLIDDASEDKDMCLMISTRDYAFKTSRAEKRFYKFEAWGILPLDEQGRNQLIDKRLPDSQALDFRTQLAAGAQQTQEMIASPFLLALLIEVFKKHKNLQANPQVVGHECTTG